jgi:hypothetical protein
MAAAANANKDALAAKSEKGHKDVAAAKAKGSAAKAHAGEGKEAEEGKAGGGI